MYIRKPKAYDLDKDTTVGKAYFLSQQILRLLDKAIGRASH